jgi:hypothetical protein
MIKRISTIVFLLSALTLTLSSCVIEETDYHRDGYYTNYYPSYHHARVYRNQERVIVSEPVYYGYPHRRVEPVIHRGVTRVYRNDDNGHRMSSDNQTYTTPNNINNGYESTVNHGTSNSGYSSNVSG